MNIPKNYLKNPDAIKKATNLVITKVIFKHSSYYNMYLISPTEKLADFNSTQLNTTKAVCCHE